jgi:hypothetical protein
MIQPSGEAFVVRLGVGAEGTANLQELDTELAVALDVFRLEAGSLCGEPVGPGEDRELLPEGSRGPGEPLGRVVRAGVTHESYLEVQHRECCYEVGDTGGEPEAPADAMGHAHPQGVVGDEQHAPLDLPARDRFGHVVKEPDDAEPTASLLVDSRTNPALAKFSFHTTDGLQDVLQGVEVMERPLPLVLGEPELRHLAEQRLRVERVCQRLVDRRVR